MCPGNVNGIEQQARPIGGSCERVYDERVTRPDRYAVAVGFIAVPKAVIYPRLARYRPRTR
jgi:hypothetical protein